MAVVYIRQILVTVVDIDPESYDVANSQVSVAEAVASNPDAYEHLATPGMFVDADYEVVTDPDEIADLNAETMVWQYDTSFAGRREPGAYPSNTSVEVDE